MIKNKILVFVPNYSPGYKAGGILRTIANTVQWLNCDFDFLIVTRDRDLGDSLTYPDIIVNEWQEVHGAKVMYLSPENISLSSLVKIVNDTEHDLIYLNSFFDSFFTIRLLLAKRFGLIANKQIILAPRGEFVEGCLRFKYLKKILYIYISKWLGFYSNVIWHASSKYELTDFINVVKVNPKDVRIALDLPVAKSLDFPHYQFSDGPLRIVFLSRITREKNLDYALTVLNEIKSSVVFDIYGPNEDPKYWHKCCELIKGLPENIIVNYFGSVHPGQVPEIFNKYDIFFFPTRGENYGHVIAEAISVGTRVLVSRNTPWLNLEDDFLGWDVNLEDHNSFVRVLENVATESIETRYKRRLVTRKNANKRLMDINVLYQNKELFKTVLD